MLLLLFVALSATAFGQVQCTCRCCPSWPCTPTDQGNLSPPPSTCADCTNTACARQFGQCSLLTGANGRNNIPVCSSIGGPVCFHADTEITYDGEPLDLAAVKRGDHADCVTPHIVTSASGVVIETVCNSKTLRLTSDHLVFSSRGLVAASRVQPSDDLYLDMEQLHHCKVTSVRNESSAQEYFGLNCRQSIVLADGYKTSTFGTLHVLPGVWMRYASVVLGVHRASRIGDAFASMLHFFGIL